MRKSSAASNFKSLLISFRKGKRFAVKMDFTKWPQLNHPFLNGWDFSLVFNCLFWSFPLRFLPQVIQTLLQKIGAIDDPQMFSLVIKTDTGEARRCRDCGIPLVMRLELGPNEQVAKMWVVEKNTESNVMLSHEVAQFYNLSLPFLEVLLDQFAAEEERELVKIKERYNTYREAIEKRLNNLAKE